MEVILISVGALCITFILVAFSHVSTHEKIDATKLKSLYKRKKNKK
jgi:hypothetical protein